MGERRSADTALSSLALALGPRVDDAARLQATKAPETLPDSCTFRPTVTSTATTGCPTNCDTVALCVADGASLSQHLAFASPG